jgi:hypothetical protein
MSFEQVQSKLRRDGGIRVGRYVLARWGAYGEWNLHDGINLTTYYYESDAINAFLAAIA